MDSEKPPFWSFHNLINLVTSNWNEILRVILSYLGIDSNQGRSQGRTIFGNVGSANEADDADVVNVETRFDDADIANRLQPDSPPSNDADSSNGTIFRNRGSANKSKNIGTLNIKTTFGKGPDSDRPAPT